MCTSTTTTPTNTPQNNKSHQQTVVVCTAVPVAGAAVAAARPTSHDYSKDIESSQPPSVDHVPQPERQDNNNDKQSLSCFNFSLGMVTGMILSIAFFHVSFHIIADKEVRHHHHYPHSSISSDSSATESAFSFTTTQAFLYSTFWSSSICWIAHVLSAALYRRQRCRGGSSCSSASSNDSANGIGGDNDDKDDVDVDLHKKKQVEYVVAFGVFFGFCLVCTIFDVCFGLPARIILWTLVIAAISVSFMTFASCYWNLVVLHQNGDDQVEEDKEKATTAAAASTTTEDNINHHQIDDRDDLQRCLLEPPMAESP